jgi:hypothetical protein
LDEVEINIRRKASHAEPSPISEIEQKEPNMPMQGGLSIPATTPATSGSWSAEHRIGFRARHIVSQHVTSDLTVVIIFSVIGLLMTIALTWLLPFSDDIGAALTRL